MGILVQVVDAVRVEKGCPAFDAVDFIAFFKQKFRQVGAVLAGYAGYERYALFWGVGSGEWGVGSGKKGSWVAPFFVEAGEEAAYVIHGLG
jgi:hypothetical protein